MFRHYQNLHHQNVRVDLQIMGGKFRNKPVNLESPAIDIMTDFKLINPLSIRENISLEDARLRMKAVKVRLMFVVDISSKIVGIVTSVDLFGEKPVKLSQEERVGFASLRVFQIMTKVDKITAIDINEIKKAKVGDIIATLEPLKRQHTIVTEIDHNNDEQLLRGIISTTQIARQLGLNPKELMSRTTSLQKLVIDNNL
jgi:CBS domain-containing protein